MFCRGVQPRADAVNGQQAVEERSQHGAAGGHDGDAGLGEGPVGRYGAGVADVLVVDSVDGDDAGYADHYDAVGWWVVLDLCCGGCCWARGVRVFCMDRGVVEVKVVMKGMRMRMMGMRLMILKDG